MNTLETNLRYISAPNSSFLYSVYVITCSVIIFQANSQKHWQFDLWKFIGRFHCESFKLGQLSIQFLNMNYEVKKKKQDGDWALATSYISGSHNHFKVHYISSNVLGKPCFIKTGVKEGPNYGKSFYICGNQKERCNFVKEAR